MPKIPVDDCPAGPAMDAAVAKALGWHYRWSGWWEDEEGQIQKPACIDCNGKSTWSPSEDIAAAWELWRKLAKRFFWVEVSTIENLKSRAALYHNIDPKVTNPIEAFGKTAPLAICRVFLKANGVEFVEIAKEETRKSLDERLKVWCTRDEY